MNIKRLILTIIVLFGFVTVYDMIVHNVLLSSAYGETRETWRPEEDMMSRMWLKTLCSLVLVIGFATIWALAFPDKGIKCGAIYGFLVSLMIATGMLTNFVFLPIPERFILPC